MTGYTLDSNILITMNRLLPRDVFGGLWDAVEDLIADGRACVCPAVVTELGRGYDDLGDWVKSQKDFCCKVTQEENDLVAQIARAHPDWVRGSVNEADPWIVAHGVVHSRAVVTEESRKGVGALDKNLGVPNVADEHGVETLNFLDLARREQWSFGRR